MKLPLMTILFSMPMFCLPAAAETLRCDGDLARAGDTKVSVLRKCGEPYFAESLCIPTLQSTLIAGASDSDRPVPLQCVVVEDWTYNPGSGQFLTTLRFEQGVVTSIKFGARIR